MFHAQAPKVSSMELMGKASGSSESNRRMPGAPEGEEGSCGLTQAHPFFVPRPPADRPSREQGKPPTRVFSSRKRTGAAESNHRDSKMSRVASYLKATLSPRRSSSRVYPEPDGADETDFSDDGTASAGIGEGDDGSVHTVMTDTGSERDAVDGVGWKAAIDAAAGIGWDADLTRSSALDPARARSAAPFKFRETTLDTLSGRPIPRNPPKKFVPETAAERHEREATAKLRSQQSGVRRREVQTLAEMHVGKNARDEALLRRSGYYDHDTNYPWLQRE